MLLSLSCSVVIMLYCYCVALLLFVLSYVLIVYTVPLPPGVNPIAVDKYININICSLRKRTWELLKEQQGAPKYVDTDMSTVGQELGENKRRLFNIKYRMPRT